MELKQFVIRNLGVLCIVCVILMITAPVILSMHSCDFFDLSDAGGIGSAIGGITTPFIGIITISLLYVTLNAQLTFNQAQQRASDFNTIISIRSNIEKTYQEITYPSNLIESRGSAVLKLDNLGAIDKSEMGFHCISENEFFALYSKMVGMSSFIHLYKQSLEASELDYEMKRLLYSSIDHYRERVIYFFELCHKENLNIRYSRYSIEDNHFKERKKMTDSCLEELKKEL